MLWSCYFLSDYEWLQQLRELAEELAEWIGGNIVADAVAMLFFWVIAAEGMSWKCYKNAQNGELRTLHECI